MGRDVPWSRLAAAVLAALVVTLPIASAKEPTMLRIPKIPRARGERLTAAEAFSATDWAGAAKVSLFTAVGNGPGIPETTTVHLLYDDRNLYAAFRCTDETMAGRAMARAYGEDLTQDEAVQIVLGLDEGGAGKQIEVGGYEAAQGVELPPVAHYYGLSAKFR